ncbi:MAG: Ldh family oxidoreductase [Rhodospirillaceae bacterium]|nr:Ldh family oxidoreductase [Rhodospirillaceae bacterium]MDE0360224.1 Ldh family oxidoreductase [Rhodospirillaceae bacterium]
MKETFGNSVVVDAERLARFCADIFERVGMDRDSARAQADVLVWANLHGVDSHGALRVPKYCAWLSSGVMNPQPRLRIDDNSPATFVVEADRAAGGVAMQAATRHAINKTRNSGLAWGIVRETTHTGPMGYYAAQIASAGMLAIVASSSRPLMAYFGARKAGVATSPIAMAAPGDKAGVVMLDMATAEIAIGKILKARATGEPIPPGSALTADGKPTTNPLEAALPMPLAGARGAGLSLMLECFQGVLVDHPLLAQAIRGDPVVHSQNGLVAAIDISLFGDVAGFRKRIDELGAAIKSLPRAEGVDAIYLPGEIERKTAAERRRDGIPLPMNTWNALLQIARDAEVEPPEPR